MRKIALIVGMILSVTLALGSIARAAVPNRSQTPIQMASTTGLTGSQAELEGALQEASGVTYKILVIDENPADRTAYLDEVLAQWGWPGANELLLVIFPEANHDIRFAMGADFKQNDLPVDELLRLVRSEYLSRSQKGDAAGGLAALIRAVNRRMSPVGTNADQEKMRALRQVVAYIEQHNVDALIKLMEPQGLHVGPYAVGAAEEGLSVVRAHEALNALVDSAKPVIAGYSLADDNSIGVAIRGIKAGQVVPADGIPNNTAILTDLVAVTLHKVEGRWRLWGFAVDPMGVMARRIEAGQDYVK